MPGPITAGKNFNYFSKTTVSNAAYTSASTISINMRNQEGISMNNLGTGVIRFSLNGTTDAGELDGSKATKDRLWEHRRMTHIWFRLVSGGASEIQVEAWGDS